jgi:molecular chaperone HscA
VGAKELTTGLEQQVEVKPSYGLTDEEVEDMLLAALDHGEDDLLARRLVEERVEAERVLAATRKALALDAALLSDDERTRILAAMDALAAATKGERPALIHARVDELDDATHAWAGRRMDRAIAEAIAGKSVGSIEATVAAAKGVDAHVAEHAR